jgi:hypothetical protein
MNLGDVRSRGPGLWSDRRPESPRPGASGFLLDTELALMTLAGIREGQPKEHLDDCNCHRCKPPREA